MWLPPPSEPTDAGYAAELTDRSGPATLVLDGFDDLERTEFASSFETTVRKAAHVMKAQWGSVAATMAIGIALSVSATARAQDSEGSAEEAAPTAEAPVEAAEEPANPDTETPSEAPSAEPPESAAPNATPMPSNDEASFNLQLRGLQERVDELKQKVYKSKARLTQLKEVVMHGAISGAKAQLVHKNEMGSSFRLVRVQYSLDGAPILNRADTGDGSLDDIEELEVFSGSIAPGEHQISVYLEYAGNGYGVFNYLENYTFKIKSSFNFTAEEGKLTKVEIVGYEKGNFTTELQDRVAVRYDQSVERATRNTEERAAAPSESD